jgi:hypothetical protein
MVDKKLCDLCGKEIPLPKNPYGPFKGGCFHTQQKRIEVCLTCCLAVERFFEDLKERYRLLEEFKKDPKSVRDQKSLDDFDGN